MWKLIFVLLFSTLFKTCAGTKSTIPVLMVDHDNVMSRLTVKPNPFAKISAPFFTEISNDALKRSECVVIFVEDQLCAEDLRIRDNFGTPFHHMQRGLNGNQVIYMPAVSEPYETLTQVFEPRISNIFHLGSGEKLHLLDQHKYVYVFFQDDDELTRSDQLRKHDILMNEIYFTVRLMKGGPVVAFYTGKSNPISLAMLRHKPVKLVQPDTSRGVLVATPDALFRLTGIFATKQTRRSSFGQTPVLEDEKRTQRTLSTTMQYSDFHLQFNFVFDDSTWNLANVALLEAGEEVGRTHINVAIPWHHSFYCNEPITILNLRDGSSITVSEYQIELKLTNSRRSLEQYRSNRGLHRSDILRTTNNSFSPSISCCPYFNSIILSGLFVVAIFTLITMWGVLMIFNCNTSDHYDDPNQKPLVIAAESTG